MSGRDSRRVALFLLLRSRRISTGKRPISASRAAIGVVRNAPAIFRSA